MNAPLVQAFAGPSSTIAAHVVIDGVRKRFDNFEALRDVSLSIAKGELVTLLGPSGCGKTTLLRIIAGFLRHDAGRIVVGGQVIDGQSPHLRNFGMVFQNYAVFPHMSVRDNVAYGLKARQIAGSELAERVEDALKRVQLAHLAERFPDALSGGQKQRVGLARAMVIRPALLLMDEPLSNLDAKLRISMRQEIRMMQRELGITTLYVTHDQEEAMAISDRIAVMERGELRQLGTPADIYDSPAAAFVADFIGGCNWLDGIMRASGRLDLGADGGFDAGIPAGGFGADTNARLALRTEDFLLATTQAGNGAAHGALEGHVLMRSFLGQRTRLTVRTRAGATIDADLPSGDALPLEGEPVRLAFPVARARIFAADDGRRLR